MSLAGNRTFVGFGFGPIQAGLFLHEAFLSGNFGRLIVAEVLANVVNAVRQAGGRYVVNIAHRDRVEVAEVGPVEIADPASKPDRTLLMDAVADAEEIATALPSVQHYTSDDPGSVQQILAAGLRKKAALGGPRAVVYAAENNNNAAEILEAKVLEAIPKDEHDRVCSRVRFLNTVIGKMSGVVTDPDEIRERGLAAITPRLPRAFLVESFNRILVSEARFEDAGGGSGFRRGITVFEEKPDLLPFEEAKLYGHNAVHALAAYIGAARGVERIADLVNVLGARAFLEAALIQESGETLIRRHEGVDALFTHEGYREYAQDLLGRMFNPHLRDTVARVGRDPARKLEWDDRLVGTIRVGLRHGVTGRRYAFGAAAALAVLDPSVLGRDTPIASSLFPLWRKASPDPAEKQAVVNLIEGGRQRLNRWRACQFPDLERFVEQPQA